MATSHHEVIQALGAAGASVVDGLHESTKLLDPRTAPATKLHKLFSIETQTRNTGKYRDHRARQMRLDLEVRFRVAWRLNPKDETSTQRTALRDEDNLVRAIQTDSRAPLDQCRIRYLRTRRQLGSSREWLFYDVVFSVEFDRSLADDVEF